MRFDVVGDQRLAGLERPFVHTVCGIVDVAVKELSVVGVIHNLTD